MNFLFKHKGDSQSFKFRNAESFFWSLSIWSKHGLDTNMACMHLIRKFFVENMNLVVLIMLFGNFKTFGKLRNLQKLTSRKQKFQRIIKFFTRRKLQRKFIAHFGEAFEIISNLFTLMHKLALVEIQSCRVYQSSQDFLQCWLITKIMIKLYKIPSIKVQIFKVYLQLVWTECNQSSVDFLTPTFFLNILFKNFE